MPEMPKIDVRPDLWDIVRNILRRHVPQYTIWAFGSRAKWTAKQYSDLDLAVITDKPLSLSVSAALVDDFSESDLPWKVDVVDWAATSKSFRRLIERDKVLVQEPQSSLGMEDEWPTVRLGDYVDSSLGKMLDTNKNKGTLAPYLGNSNVRWGQFDLADLAQMRFEPHEAERYGIRDGDLVVCEGGEPGRCAIWREQIPSMKIQKALHRVRAKHGLNNRYLFYWFMLAGRTGQIEPYFTGTTIKHLTGKALAELQVLFPPPEKQRAIAHILGTLDDKIELNRRMNLILEAMARALFKSWFVDFDGVPPEDMHESELGLIPRGWRIGTLGDIAEHTRRNVQSEEIETTSPYIALEHMPRGCIALADWGVADGLESNKYEFKRGEILFGKLRPYFHKVGIAPVDGVCSTDIIVITPKSPAWFGFVLALASSDAFIEYTNAGSTGTKMPRTSWSEMSRHTVALPSESMVAAFNQQMSQMAEKIILNIHESRTLAQLRDILLPKLVSGKLRVSNGTQQALEEATA